MTLIPKGTIVYIDDHRVIVHQYVDAIDCYKVTHSGSPNNKWGSRIMLDNVYLETLARRKTRSDNIFNIRVAYIKLERQNAKQ